ncbi:MAG: 30S ribosomal protein S18 [bacterium]|nr:30S ribosomal protein S18 [bacterium]
MAGKSGKRKSKRIKFKPVPTNCIFCKHRLVPDYKDYDNLGKFISDRAKIVGKDRTGVCSKHQKALGVEIKRARHLGLLPFTPSLD